MAEIRRNSPEILAPAGDRERLEAALREKAAKDNGGCEQK